MGWTAAVYDIRLDGQRQLLGRTGRGEAQASAVPDVALAGEPRNPVTNRFYVVGAEIGPTGIELLVQRQLLRPVLGQMRKEVLTRARAQEEQVRPDPGRPRLPRGTDDLAELLGAVGDPREDRRHADGRLHPGVDELLHGLQPLARVRRRRLGPLPYLLVKCGDRERDRD